VGFIRENQGQVVLPAVAEVPVDDPAGDVWTQLADGEVVGDVAVVTGFVVRYVGWVDR